MKDKIAIIGLGYVGLPLARLFATKYSVVGSAVIKYRKELKCIRNQVAEDLIEDFGFGKISFQKEIEEYSAAIENAKDVMPNQFIKNMDEAQKILDNEKINELNKG